MGDSECIMISWTDILDKEKEPQQVSPTEGMAAVC